MEDVWTSSFWEIPNVQTWSRFHLLVIDFVNRNGWWNLICTCLWTKPGNHAPRPVPRPWMMLLAKKLSKPRREQIKREQKENDIEIVKVKKHGLKNSVWGPYCFQGSFTRDASQFKGCSKPNRNLFLIMQNWVFATTDWEYLKIGDPKIFQFQLGHKVLGSPFFGPWA